MSKRLARLPTDRRESKSAGLTVKRDERGEEGKRKNGEAQWNSSRRITLPEHKGIRRQSAIPYRTQSGARIRIDAVHQARMPDGQNEIK
jgi:hypothetical protein